MDVRLSQEISHLACLERFDATEYGPLMALTCGLEVMNRTLALMEAEH